MPTEDQSESPEPRVARRRAVTAAVGNATALGLGFAYLRRWDAFGVNLFFAGLIGVFIWRSEPPARFWFAAAALLAAATALAGWRAAGRAGAAIQDTVRPDGPLPFPGSSWLPAFAAVLVGYAGAFGWFAVGAHRILDAQTEAHADGDCGAAAAMAEEPGWGHRTFAAGTVDDVLWQADTCELYLDAESITEPDGDATDLGLRLKIDYLEWYLDRPNALLRGQAADEIDRTRSDLVIEQLSGYRYDGSLLIEEIAELQDLIEAEPDSPLAEQASADLDGVIAQWGEDIGDEDRVCHLSGLFLTLFPERDRPQVMTEPGPISDPLLEAEGALGAAAALGCAEVLIESAEADAESEPGSSEERMERAVELLERVVRVYPDGDEAAAAEEILRGLGG